MLKQGIKMHNVQAIHFTVPFVRIWCAWCCSVMSGGEMFKSTKKKNKKKK